MSANEPILFVAADGVATITMNRPASLNALDREARRALRAAMAEAEADTIRAVVLTGAGRAFSVGQDVAELQRDYAADGPQLARLIQDEWGPIVDGIRSSAKPYIAAVNGAAAGGGLSLALACDIRLVEPRTLLIAAFINVGLVPDSGAAHMLVRTLGLSRAMALALTGDRLTAADAQRVGLAAAIADSAETLLPDALALAQRFCGMAPLALASAKRVMNQAADLAFPEVVALEAEHQDWLGHTNDHQEALAAFLEKRPPRFQGR